MAKYTVTLKEYAEQTLLAAYTGNDPIGYINSLTPSDFHRELQSIFPQRYFFYVDDDDVRAEFETQFIDRFFFYEIGQETIGVFKWFLRSYLNERMPYFKQLYDSQIKDFADAIENYKKTRNASMDITDTETRDLNFKTKADANNTLDSTVENYVNPINTSTMQAQSKVKESGNPNAHAEEEKDETGSVSNVKQHGEKSTESGYIFINKMQLLEKFRQLMFSINESIFCDVEQKGLFMRVW